MRRVLQSEKLFLFSYFLGAIAFGTAVLYLPLSWAGAGRLALVDALFTATSAVCVTGLITVDTAAYSILGQVLILVLIQAGGLGIITFSTIYLARPRGRISLIRHKVIRGYYLESSGLSTLAIIRRIVAVVDLGNRLEASILVTNYLKKIGIGQIIARAESKEHGEILDLVGATKAIFPNLEAARRIAPFLISSQIFSYLPISSELVVAEVKVPEKFFGKSLVEVDMRRKYSLNVIAYRKLDGEEYFFYAPEYRLQGDDILLVGGRERDIDAFTEEKLSVGTGRITGLFHRFFSRKS